MDILVIGVSTIFNRRVLPALLSLECVDKIHLASRRTSIETEIPQPKRGEFFCGYEEALRRVRPCLAYISLPNNLHAVWTRKALLAGFHVVVDKPAFLSWQETEANLKLANDHQLCLAESTVWPFHPQVNAIQRAFDQHGCEPKAIQAVFSFPPLPPSNFRNKSDMGGGSFYDLGRYAVTPGRVFFKDEPTHVRTEVLSHDPASGIDTSFAISLKYSRGRYFQGFFSFNAAYKNSISIIGDKMTAILDPAFTFSDPLMSKINIRVDSNIEELSFKPSNSFAAFFEAVIQSIQSGDWSAWLHILERDAYAMHRASAFSTENSL
jgi:NDP-hexose-3-ketoreductase